MILARIDPRGALGRVMGYSLDLPRLSIIADDPAKARAFRASLRDTNRLAFLSIFSRSNRIASVRLLCCSRILFLASPFWAFSDAAPIATRVANGNNRL